MPPTLSLAQRLADIPPQRLALLQGGRTLAFGQLHAVAAAPFSRVVTLGVADLWQALPELVALDGAVAVIRLTSSPDTAQLPTTDFSFAGESRWAMATSGTTGVPKLVGHTLASLTRTMRVNVVRGAGERWGLLYDPARFAGLQVVLHALLNGATLIVPRPGCSLAAQVAELAQAGCSHLSATPTLWRKILMTPGWSALALQQVTLGGEIADQSILNGLAHAFPHARITHIFASTEAGVGFAVADGQEGFPVDYLHHPPRGVALQVVAGRLRVANPLVSPCYLTGQGAFCDPNGFIDTGDEVAVVGQRVLFRGRTGGTINVGGHKVHPEAVERVVHGHPQVALCRVGRRPNPFTGEVVTLEVVPREQQMDPVLLEESVRAWCFQHLERPALPVAVRVVPAIAVNPVGKTDRGCGS